MTEILDQIDNVHDATNRFIKSSVAHTDAHFNSGNHEAGTQTLLNMLDGLEAKNNIVQSAMQERAKTAQQIIDKSVSQSNHLPKNSGSTLPKGMSNGKIAAIIAGAAVIGGGIYLYNQAQKKKQQSWAARIEQERALAIAPHLSL